MNLMTAHHQWASRPPDERFQGLDALAAAVSLRQTRSRDYMLKTKNVQIIPKENGELTIAGSKSEPEFTNWSMGQLSSLVKAPAKFMASLKPQTAANVFNERLGEIERPELKILLTEKEGAAPDLRAMVSEKYGRIYDAQAVDLVRGIVDNSDHTWRPPLGYKDGQWGAELVPSGLYAGDRDCFMFLVEEDHPVEVRGELLKRGFIVQNSEVGARTFSLLAFLYRLVCGNNIIWGSEILADVKIRHIGRAMGKVQLDAVPKLHSYIEADPRDDVKAIVAAHDYSVGKNNEEVGEFLRKKSFTRLEAEGAIEAAIVEENGPNSLWGVVQGLTAFARTRPNADARLDLEKRAGNLLQLVS